jgi:hypothetical protein
MLKKLILYLLAISCLSVYSQDIEYARRVMQTLTAPDMHGRAYVKDGALLASEFINREFGGFALKSFTGEDYFQDFTISINTYPDTVVALVDGNRLVPGYDFTVVSSSPGIRGTFDMIRIPNDTAKKNWSSFPFNDQRFAGKFVVTEQYIPDAFDHLDDSTFAGKGLIMLNGNKLTWHVKQGKQVGRFPVIMVAMAKLPPEAGKITLDIRNEFIEACKVRNVIGWVDGKERPDTFVVFTAHFDGLGQMGSDVYFPGAQDNASGTAMLLDLARHFCSEENRPRYSVAFIACTSEEVGLLGSQYYVQHPCFPLDRIKFLINLDLVGSGSEGITVVNGEKFEKAYNALVDINTSNEYIRTVKKRGESPNSDHHPFYAAGVPAVFIYTMGPECKEGHNPDDNLQNCPLTEYKDVFRLIVDFTGSLR